MHSSLYVSELLGNAPLGCLPVRGPAFLDFVTYCTCLLGLLSGWALRKDRLPITCSALALILCVYGWRYYHNLQQTEITVLPFNGAASVYVDSPHASQRVLFDPGTTNDVTLTGKAFLRSRGMDRVPWLVLTHGDTRHVSGAPLLATLLPVENAVVSPIRFRSSPYRRSLDHLKKCGATFNELQNNDDFAGWTVLHPQAGDRNTLADDNSLVAIAHLHGWRVLLLSDLSRQGQARLIERHPELRTDILVIESPANGPPFSEGFLEVVRPEAVILCDSNSSGSSISSGNPTSEGSSQRSNIQTVHTRTAGAVTVRLSSSGWFIRTMAGQEFRNGRKVADDAGIPTRLER
jgi:beta-lactamase superfamily II metal-dependent hydrolase